MDELDLVASRTATIKRNCMSNIEFYLSELASNYEFTPPENLYNYSSLVDNIVKCSVLNDLDYSISILNELKRFSELCDGIVDDQGFSCESVFHQIILFEYLVSRWFVDTVGGELSLAFLHKSLEVNFSESTPAMDVIVRLVNRILGYEDVCRSPDFSSLSPIDFIDTCHTSLSANERDLSFCMFRVSWWYGLVGTVNWASFPNTTTGLIFKLYDLPISLESIQKEFAIKKLKNDVAQFIGP